MIIVCKRPGFICGSPSNLLGKLGQALCSAPFYETTGRLSQEKDDIPTPPTPSPTTANPQPLERGFQRDWAVSEGTLPTPDSSWG